MARTVRDANLESRTARGRLSPSKKPYWRTIDQGCHIGYYKGKRAGSWIARMYLGDGKYAESKLGPADDIQDADGISVFSFSQAQSNARDWFQDQAKKTKGVVSIESYTVGDALDDYLDWYRANRRSITDTTHRIETHVRPALGDVRVLNLTPDQIGKWHHSLAQSPPRARTRRRGPLSNGGRAPAGHRPCHDAH